MQMRERRRRVAVVDEAPTKTARAEMDATPIEVSDEARPAGMADQAEAVARVGFAPIVRVDAATREVELCATSEALDSHGTVFDYAASKDAFTRWIGLRRATSRWVRSSYNERLRFLVGKQAVGSKYTG